MAALLRSARLLKFAPSGLLQIAGNSRNGPPLRRLYGGALGGVRPGVCPQHVGPAAGSTSSPVWPYAVGCVRSYVVATEKKDDASVAVQSKQAQQFDWALNKLDNSVRRTGRITKTMLLRIFHDICRAGYPSGNQALLLLRSCGSLLPEVPMEERTELAHRVWEKLQELGAQYDASHYNALLKVYLQNGFKFTPTDFLAKMEAANVQPNRVTYQRLIAAYCENGDIEGASTILGFMKSKDLPITDAVFNSLVTGHARAGDIESAKNVLSVMSGAGMEPGPDTYLSLLNAYAEKGDMDSVKKTLEEAESADCTMMDRDIMQVIFTLAKARHPQHIPEMVERLKHERGYVPDAMNLCLSLITQGLEDTAFHILKTFPSVQGSGADSPTQGNFLLRHCVNMDMPAEKLGHYCKELQELNMHATPLSFTLFCAVEAKKTGMALELMKIFKEQNLPIRSHYFWPLLTQHLKDNNVAGVVELLKGMQELGVSPDAETLSIYVLPVFPSLEAAQQALQEAGISLESEGYVSSVVRLMAVKNLGELYTKLSDPSFPSMDLSLFRGSLILGFRKSTDVESMVKITELLYKDQRFSKVKSSPVEATSFFLYNMIESMSAKEVQIQEDKLRQYFKQLKELNITIPGNVYRGIRNLLDAYQVPELIKDVVPLVNDTDRTSTDLVAAAPRVTSTKICLRMHHMGIEGKVLALEKKLAELKAENKPFSVVLKQIIHTLCAEENLERALELKQQHEEEMTVGSYATLINLCCRHNNVEEALNLKREMNRKDSSIALDAGKYIALVKALARDGRVEEAVDILKEMKEKEVVMNDTHITSTFHMLNAIAAKGNAPAVQQLQDTIFSLGLAKPTTNLCSPLITAYLDSKDLSRALEALMECHKRYNQLPRIHDIIVGLVENGDTELLQKAMDFVSQKRGEMTMLYDLFFAFLQTGRYREARKIIETPGLRARPGRLQWYAEKCISANQMEALEQMVEMTAKLFECDRDEMYSYILRLCKETNDWQKADAVWTKMQEENIIPRERTLHMLADILKNNGQEVPFEEPESWYKQATTTEEQVQPAKPPPSPENSVGYETRLLALCKKGNPKEAFTLLKEVNKKGVTIGPTSYDHLIRALLSKGSMEDAMAVKEIAQSHLPNFQLSDTANSLLIITQTKKGGVKEALETLKVMLQADQVPMQLTVTRLIQALGSLGNVAGIQEVESLLKGLGTTLNMSSMVFVNNTALAHIKNGDLETAVEVMEAVFTAPDSTHPSMSFVFRKIFEDNNDKAIDKLTAMAERLANHFACYRPATDVFLELLNMDRVEDAKFMLARCNAVAEQKTILLSYVSQKARNPGEVGKMNSWFVCTGGKDPKLLLSLIPDFADKEVLNTYLMKCHVQDKDLSSAKALYEQMQKEGMVLDELSLKRLAVLYREAGETAPFPEPPSGQ
ncbi:hypothetical protein L3Q82_001820 [Scortum barcoo]|uniref:Uncharacterized protein n=1 Tax=Scortum barcoo TaxID=214431 RepID=A0ACB8W438_9TELE|nr:hypothetical protein L3Q82_001820 [Scortum barcoo]